MSNTINDNASIEDMVKFMVQTAKERNWEVRKIDGILARLRSGPGTPLNTFKEICMRENIDAKFGDNELAEENLDTVEFTKARQEAGLPVANKEGDQNDPKGVTKLNTPDEYEVIDDSQAKHTHKDKLDPNKPKDKEKPL